MLKTRILSIIFGLPILLGILYFKGNVLFISLIIVTLIALREFYNSAKPIGIKPIESYGYFVSIIYLAAAYFIKSNNFFAELLALSFIGLMTYVILTYKNNFNDILVTIFGLLYVTFFFSQFLLILELKNSDIIILLPFITAWGTDTCAYIFGLTMGKRKLCPAISPKKSVEGAIGGSIGCTVLTFLFGVFVNLLGYKISLIHFIVIGLICGIFSQIGDLTASFWKRHTGIKDFGKIMPGHGGILDRFDSVIFTLPIIYNYFAYCVK